jgi:hypothetical protein
MGSTPRMISVFIGFALSLACAATVSAQECSGGMYSVLSENIEKTKEQALGYKPGDRTYYVQDFNDRRNVYLWAAISPSERADFMERFDADPATGKCIGKLIDELGVVAKRTLPSYRPAGYTTKTPAEERLLRGAVPGATAATVYRAGVEGPDWRIDKNDYGIPTVRYKYGMVYLKMPTQDDGFCRIAWVNIVQDYAGGGTYGSSRGSYIKIEPAGCPEAK